MYFTYPNRDLICPVVSDVIYSVRFNSLFIYIWLLYPTSMKLVCIEKGVAI